MRTYTESTARKELARELATYKKAYRRNHLPRETARYLAREINALEELLRANQETKMQTQTMSTETKIAELKQRYTRLALECRAAGLRVNPETIAKYAEELQRLQALLA